MIARYRFLLPYLIDVDASATFEELIFTFSGYIVRVYPPLQAPVILAETDWRSPVPLVDVLGRMRATSPPECSPAFRIQSYPYDIANLQAADFARAAPSYAANLIQIDFTAESFERRFEDISLPPPDPPLETARQVANLFLAALRSTTSASFVEPLGEGAWWLVEYLADDGTTLPVQEGLRRAVGNGRVASVNCAIDASVWEGVCSKLPNYVPPAWETLLLEAERLLPAVGPSIVLICIALETLVDQALDVLAARSAIPPDLWEWMNNRDFYLKNPSVTDRYGTLLGLLAGRSLKDKADLWQAFGEIREARNNYAHEGKAYLTRGKARTQIEVSQEMAARMLASAKEIAAWTEELLPPENRRPTLAVKPRLLMSRVIIPQTIAATSGESKASPHD
jgi:hypothetical protein